MSREDLDLQAVNTIRFLSVDAIQKANSGHPGMPLDAAPMAYVLWTRLMKYNPKDPEWFDRDRFVLSAGHGSMLLYSMLHLTGYDLSLEDIRQFRQWESKAPGHPEHGMTPGVETTTGPLGQGFGSAVGMAIAEAHLAARFNRPDFPVVDHCTWSIVSDGDLMEGVSAEAASLAGHMKLGKLICLYDDNRVSLSGTTNLTFTEDVGMRFKAYGWHVQAVRDGNDLSVIAKALRKAKKETERPSLIMIRTHIGYGSPHKQDTFMAHGSPLGEEEVRLTKENLGWPTEPPFLIPDKVLALFRRAIRRGRKEQARWKDLIGRYASEHPELAAEFGSVLQGELREMWDANLPVFPSGEKPMATREAIGKVMNASVQSLPALIGGSADLDPSTNTQLKGMGDFENASVDQSDVQGTAGGPLDHSGRNIHFGVREHAMGAILNGMAVHGATLPYGATFLIFSDYLRPPMRLAALMKAHVIYIFTHDSVAVGEDGPTHQPVEQLLSLRAVPGMTVIRPADANEAAAAWRVAVEHTDGPVALVLSRQKLPVLDTALYHGMREGVKAGGYILAGIESGPDVVLVATGSEVHLALAARMQLKDKEGINARVVNLPCCNLFRLQPESYRRQVLPPDIPILVVEAGVSLGWDSYLDSSGSSIGVNSFGASAPGDVLLVEYGFTAENVCRRALALVRQSHRA